MHRTSRTLCHVLAALLIGGAALAAPSPAGQDPSADLVKQGQGKLREGRLDEALALFRQALEASPNAYQANGQTGVVLDRAQLQRCGEVLKPGQARLAARRGHATDARAHVAAAKVILDKGTNPDQAQFFPYLTGYVAFYGGDYPTALAELQKASQNDPFILSLIAQTYEKLGDDAQAKECYRKVLTSNAHNPTNAFARPLAKKKLGQG